MPVRPGDSQRAPPQVKKPRKRRGRNSKSHDGDTPANVNQPDTDITPSEYLNQIQTDGVQEDEQLSASQMTYWKRKNDETNFSGRVDQDPEVHLKSKALQFLQEKTSNCAEDI